MPLFIAHSGHIKREIDMTDLLKPYYQILVDFGEQGRGNAADPIESRDEAISVLADIILEDVPFAALRIYPPRGMSIGMVHDVTKEIELESRAKYTVPMDLDDEISDPTDDKYGEWKEGN